jgi:glutamine synthetase
MGIVNLPENLKDALKALKKNTVVREAIGVHVYEKFVAAKQKEWDEFRTSVTEWEIKKYLKVM